MWLYDLCEMWRDIARSKKKEPDFLQLSYEKQKDFSPNFKNEKNIVRKPNLVRSYKQPRRNLPKMRR